VHTADSWMCNVGTRYLRALVASGPGPAWTAAQRTSVHAPASIMKKKHATFASLPHQQQSWEWNARGIDNCEIGMFVPPIDLQARPGFTARVSISSTAKKKSQMRDGRGKNPAPILHGFIVTSAPSSPWALAGSQVAHCRGLAAPTNKPGSNPS
jgi:hypothetical protein